MTAIPIRKILPGYFRLSKVYGDHEFLLLIPMQLRTSLTFVQLKCMFGEDPDARLSYIPGMRNEPAIQLPSFNA
jgi:hypothetical protein